MDLIDAPNNVVRNLYKIAFDATMKAENEKDKNSSTNKGRVSYNPGGIPSRMPGRVSPIDEAALKANKFEAASDISPTAMEELIEELE